MEDGRMEQGMRRALTTAFGASCVLFVACSGDQRSQHERGDGGTDAGVSDGATGAAGGAPSSGGASNGGASSGGTLPGGAGGHVDAATNPHDAAAPDASREAGITGSPPRDAASEADVAPEAGPDPDGTVACATVTCGDGVRQLIEECDDANGVENDFCDRCCVSHDRLALYEPKPAIPDQRKRFVLRGRAVAANAEGAAVLFRQRPPISNRNEPEIVGLQIFRPDGTRVLGDLGKTLTAATGWSETSSAGQTDGHLIALPGNRYALVWQQYPLGGAWWSIGLREIDGATGNAGPVQVVNTTVSGNQRSPDAVWTGSELVVAWTDETTALQDHVRFRRFGSDLVPKGPEESLEPSPRTAAVRLATFAGGWATQWIESSPPNYNPDFFVRAGTKEWVVRGLYGAVEPTLIALSDTHLLLVSTGAVFHDGGTDTRHLFGAILDVASPGEVRPFRLRPRLPEHADDGFAEETAPVVARVGDTVYLAWYQWTVLALQGEFIKPMRWNAATNTLALDTPESPAPRDVRRGNDEFALTVAPWGAGSTLFAAWTETWGFPDQPAAADVAVTQIPLPVPGGI
jgi:cysteine-rich repeat protein